MDDYWNVYDDHPLWSTSLMGRDGLNEPSEAAVQREDSGCSCSISGKFHCDYHIESCIF